MLSFRLQYKPTAMFAPMKLEREDNRWKSNEDEILKLGIMKYGIHKWNKVCSLLTNRTPLECKERWYNYLHPDINKEEWSAEETKSLLELAESLSPQWKLIGGILNRPEQECYEKYNSLVYKSIEVVKHAELEDAEGNLEDEIYKSAISRISTNKSRKIKKKEMKKKRLRKRN